VHYCSNLRAVCEAAAKTILPEPRSEAAASRRSVSCGLWLQRATAAAGRTAAGELAGWGPAAEVRGGRRGRGACGGQGEGVWEARVHIFGTQCIEQAVRPVRCHVSVGRVQTRPGDDDCTMTSWAADTPCRRPNDGRRKIWPWCWPILRRGAQSHWGCNAPALADAGGRGERETE
jgi:hypothetical protein